MNLFVKKYDLGIVGESFEPQDLADSLNNLSFEKILYYKQQAHKHAKELSEIEKSKLTELGKTREHYEQLAENLAKDVSQQGS